MDENEKLGLAATLDATAGVTVVAEAVDFGGGTALASVLRVAFDSSLLRCIS